MAVEPDNAESVSNLLDKRILRDDPRFAAGKITFSIYAMVAAFLFLILGYWDLQVQHGEIYSEQAQRNSIKTVPIVAPRGKIVDRDGRVIVDNESSYRLLLSRERLKPEHLRPIADGLGLDYAELEERLRRFDKRRPKYEPMVIKENLTQQELAFVEAHRDPDFFPELELIGAFRRVYPAGGLGAHMIGYTSEVSESELDSAEFARYEQGDIVGKAGIERQYNDSLRGVDGQRRVEVDYRGVQRRTLTTKPSVPGKNLRLTIDLDVQIVAEMALQDRRGAVIALDPRSGEVLAMVSRPAFDPNKFASRILSADWREINDNPDKPLLNRAIQAQLAPGSTFKPLMAIAGLTEGAIDENTTTSCGGGASFYGRYHACWQKRGHGTLALRRAIAQSCDVYFYTLGNRMGIDTIAKYGDMAGLGRKTGIDLPGEKEGLLPSTAWKIRTQRQRWYPGETISVAIGQGALNVTPLQLAHAIGGLAIGGTWYRPHLVQEQRDTNPRKVELDAENVRRVVGGMWAVVNEGGTGGVARIAGLDVSGKTGTAQVVSNEFLKNNKNARPGDYRDNGWFVGFAPRDNPEIVVVALYEAGEHGTAAAPIVRDVIKAYFDKKAARPVGTQLSEVR